MEDLSPGLGKNVTTDQEILIPHQMVAVQTANGSVVEMESLMQASFVIMELETATPTLMLVGCHVPFLIVVMVWLTKTTRNNVMTETS